jgi:hypothetical protein
MINLIFYKSEMKRLLTMRVFIGYIIGILLCTILSLLSIILLKESVKALIPDLMDPIFPSCRPYNDHNISLPCELLHDLSRELPAFRAGFTPFPSSADSGASQLPHPMPLVKAWAKGLPPSRTRNIRAMDFRGVYI